MKVDVQTIKDQLKLTPHPEGGFFKENYRSSGSINEANLWKGVQGSRNFSTADPSVTTPSETPVKKLSLFK